MLVYAVRHAESLANAQQSTHPDAGLSPLGRDQADRLRERFRNIPLSAIYSSPFERCLQTAAPIARAAGLPIQLRAELCEFHNLPPGVAASFSLRSADDIARAHADVDFAFRAESVQWPPMDEPFAGVVARTARFARELKQVADDPPQSVLVISHGSPIARFIDAWLTDLPGPSFRFIIDNASVAALRHHARVSSLVCLNDFSHLAGLPPPRASNLLPGGAIRPVSHTDYW